MLRKIKSKSFLSPGKTSRFSSPNASPEKAQAARSKELPALLIAGDDGILGPVTCDHSAPDTKHHLTSQHDSRVEKKGQARPSVFDCQATSTTLCDRLQKLEHENESKVKGLRRRASAWLGLTPSHESRAYSTNTASREEVVQSRSSCEDSCETQLSMLALHTALCCEYSSTDDRPQEMLLLVDLKAYLPGSRSRHVDRVPLNLVFILDISQTSSHQGRSSRQGSIALRLIQNLEPDDQVGILTTVSGTKQRVVSAFSVVGNTGKRALTRHICDLSVENQVGTTDVLASLRQALLLLNTTKYNESHIIFISDGCNQLKPEDLVLLRQEFRSARTKLHAIPAGAISDLSSLRVLAHTSSHGTLLPSGSSQDLSALLLRLRTGQSNNVITHVELHFQLHDGATFLGIRDEEVTVKSSSGHDFTLMLDRLGPQEARQIMIAIRVPAVQLPKEPQRRQTTLLSHSIGVSEDDVTDNSFRLAELDHMVRSMPGILATMLISYHHPYLTKEARICLSSKTLALKRSSTMPKEPDVVVRTIDAHQSFVNLLHLANSYAKSSQMNDARYLLNELELRIHSFCINVNISPVEFDELLIEISAQKSQLIQVNPFSSDITQTLGRVSSSIMKGSTTPHSLVERMYKNDPQVTYPEHPSQAALPQARQYMLPSSLAISKCSDSTRFGCHTEALDVCRGRRKQAASANMVLKSSPEPLKISSMRSSPIVRREAKTEPLVQHKKIVDDSLKPQHTMPRSRSSLELRKVASTRGYSIELSDYANERSLRLTEHEVLDFLMRDVRDESDCSRQRTEKYVSDQRNGHHTEELDRAKRIWESHKVERGEISMHSLDAGDYMDSLDVLQEPNMSKACKKNPNTSMLDEITDASAEPVTIYEDKIPTSPSPKQATGDMTDLYTQSDRAAESPQPSSVYSTVPE